MTEAEVYIAAEQALTNVIKQIKTEQLKQNLPDWFQIGRTQDRSKITLRDIINYHAYDTAWVPETLAGKTIAEVGDKYDGDLLGEGPIASYMKLADAAIAAAKTAELDKTVHLTYGDWPAREYFKHITSFRGFRTYDIAKLIGADTKLPDDLVQGMYEEFKPEAENWRKMGIFGPEYPTAADSDLQTKLFAMCGHQL